MKKTLFFIAAMALAMATMAQDKVAILETVDKTGEVSYGIKLLLRSSLTSAISNTPGYEGYDRVDMAAIAGEQEFQRTGNVSDDQIRQLGVASGAKYVLVAEVAKYDEVRVIITAKLLDVETFGVKSSGVQITGTSAGEMQKSCEQLAKQLFKAEPQPKAPQKTTEKAEKVEKTKQPKEKYRRTTWTGLSIDGGALNIVEEHNELNTYYSFYTLGATLDLSFPIFNWLSIGPYVGGYAAYNPDNQKINNSGFNLGGMMKVTFRNDVALMLGIGYGAFILKRQEILDAGIIRVGIKFRSPWYMTGSLSYYDYYYSNSNGWTWANGVAFNLGVGYSFGGKKKPIE